MLTARFLSHKTKLRLVGSDLSIDYIELASELSENSEILRPTHSGMVDYSTYSRVEIKGCVALLRRRNVL